MVTLTEYYYYEATGELLKDRMKYPDYVPLWYSPKISYELMQKYGDKSKELENYLKHGKI